MGTRAIVTFHPDVECDVCGRRLLRGEQPDVFLTGGQRRMVCELCSPRAAHEGWLREADGHLTSSRSARPQRGRSLLGRLRQSRWPAVEAGSQDAAGESPESARLAAPQDEHYDFLEGPAPARADQSLSDVPDDELAGADTASVRRARGGRGGTTTGELKVERALEVFNGSQQPRRVAGVARSLGVPAVRAVPVADSGSVVSIVVAWELCWYRYAVDLGDEAAGVQLTAQGMELDELPDEDRVGNAVVDERGELSLLDV